MKTIFLFFLVFLSILHQQQILADSQAILHLFIHQLLPSLFFLCVIIQMIPLASFSLLDPLTRKLFNINSTSFFLILKMILIGNPASSYMVDSLSNVLTEKQTIRLISCVAIPSFSFMLMTLSLLTSLKLAITCFLIQVTSIFLLLSMTKKEAIDLSYQIPTPSLSNAIKQTVHTMVMIISYLFLTTALKSFFIIYFPTLRLYIEIFMEFSSAASFLSHQSNPLFYFLIIFGFGGLCSHLQVINGCSRISIHPFSYLMFRFLHISINLLIYFIFSLPFLM